MGAVPLLEKVAAGAKDEVVVTARGHEVKGKNGQCLDLAAGREVDARMRRRAKTPILIQKKKRIKRIRKRKKRRWMKRQSERDPEKIRMVLLLTNGTGSEKNLA